jgi:hypothetical protein
MVPTTLRSAVADPVEALRASVMMRSSIALILARPLASARPCNQARLSASRVTEIAFFRIR